MTEELQKLDILVNSLPATDSARSYSQLNVVLSKYTSILNYINSYNEEFKRATSLYYNDIPAIRDNIEYSLYSSSPKEKTTAFLNARKELETDIQALATLIKPRQPEPEAVPL